MDLELLFLVHTLSTHTHRCAQQTLPYLTMNLSWMMLKLSQRKFESSGWGDLKTGPPYPHSPETCKSYSYTDVDLFGTHTVLLILSSWAQIKAMGRGPYLQIDVALAANSKAFHCSEGLSHLTRISSIWSTFGKNMVHVQGPVAWSSFTCW